MHGWIDAGIEGHAGNVLDVVRQGRASTLREVNDDGVWINARLVRQVRACIGHGFALETGAHGLDFRGRELVEHITTRRDLDGYLPRSSVNLLDGGSPQDNGSAEQGI